MPCGVCLPAVCLALVCVQAPGGSCRVASGVRLWCPGGNRGHGPDLGPLCTQGASVIPSPLEPFGVFGMAGGKFHVQDAQDKTQSPLKRGGQTPGHLQSDPPPRNVQNRGRKGERNQLRRGEGPDWGSNGQGGLGLRVPFGEGVVPQRCSGLLGAVGGGRVGRRRRGRT